MATAAPESHLRENPFQIAQQQLENVARTFGIDDRLVAVLSQCKKAVEVSIPTSLESSSADIQGNYIEPEDPAQLRASSASAASRQPLPTRFFELTMGKRPSCPLQAAGFQLMARARRTAGPPSPPDSVLLTSLDADGCGLRRW